MTQSEKILAVIPARGGSKGVPGKNIRLLAGKPLIAHTIASAKKSRLITKLIVSTDDDAIARVARDSGAEVPFVRPAEYATDKALAIDVMKHALESMEKVDGVKYDFLVMLQPTTPLKSEIDIDGSIQKLIETGCDSVVSVVDVGANHPARMYTIENDRMVSVMDEKVAMRPRQDLPPVYIRSGAVYACRREVLFEYNALIGKDCRPFIMPEERSVNIDDLRDFYLAEYYLKEKI